MELVFNILLLFIINVINFDFSDISDNTIIPKNGDRVQPLFIIQNYFSKIHLSV